MIKRRVDSRLLNYFHLKKLVDKVSVIANQKFIVVVFL